MPIVLTSEEMAFVRRIQSYCEAGLSQPQMAEREQMSTPGIRDRLRRYGLEFSTRVDREIVRVRSGERLLEMIETGDLVATPAPEREAVAAEVPA